MYLYLCSVAFSSPCYYDCEIFCFFLLYIFRSVILFSFLPLFCAFFRLFFNLVWQFVSGKWRERERERERLRQWFFNRFSEFFFLSLSSIRIKRQMKRWLKLLSKSNPKRKNACHRNKETNKTNKCGLRQNRSVPLPFHSPYSKYTTKINEQFQLEQKKIQIYSNPSKKHPSQQKQQHIPHRMATNTQCKLAQAHATSIEIEEKWTTLLQQRKWRITQRVLKLFARLFCWCALYGIHSCVRAQYWKENIIIVWLRDACAFHFISI